MLFAPGDNRLQYPHRQQKLCITMQESIQNVLLAKDGLFELSKEALAGKERNHLLKAIEGDLDELLISNTR